MGIIYHSYNLKRKKYILKTRKWKEPKIYLSHFINEKTETTIKKISSQISDISSKSRTSSLSKSAMYNTILIISS